MRRGPSWGTSKDAFVKPGPVVMGPCFRRDDGLIRHCQRWMRPVRIYHRPASDATHSISISIAGFGSALTTQVVRAG
jgi:hypothetical protein